MKEVNYFDILNKILVCLIIIIALLALNLILSLTGGGSSTPSTGDDTQEQTGVYDVSSFNTVTIEQSLDLFDSEDAQVIFFGAPTCGYCIEFIPVLEAAQAEYDMVHHYLDVSAVTEDETEFAEEMAKLMSVESPDPSAETYGDLFGVTPMVIIVKDGEMISGNLGYVDETTYFAFLEDNGF